MIDVDADLQALLARFSVVHETFTHRILHIHIIS